MHDLTKIEFLVGLLQCTEEDAKSIEEEASSLASTLKSNLSNWIMQKPNQMFGAMSALLAVTDVQTTLMEFTRANMEDIHGSRTTEDHTGTD